MAPPLLTLQNIHLTFGVTPLLAGADLQVEEGERLCLVGRNGSGKSTLLKVAAGLVEADEGDRFVHPSATVRYLEQDPDLSAHATIRDYVMSGLAPGDADYRADYLMERLGLTGDETPAQVSGGEARRAALVRALAPDPDILLLDEPTNHLDLPAIEWLEVELRHCRSALVLISHDRRFLENLTRKTVWLDRGQTRQLDRGFGEFESWRDTVLEQEQDELHKLDRKIVREEDWLRYGVTARRKRNVRRLGELNALKQQRRDHRGPQGTVKLETSEAGESGKLVAEAKSVSLSYGERAIVKDFSTKIARNARIGLVGPNGAGKTTLLNILTGQLEPDAGTVRLGTKLEIASLDQKRVALKDDWTLSEALTQGSGNQVEVGGKTKHVVAYMKDFLFPPEQANTPVHVLSGGERARIMLARALALPSNLLVLDEPTNDLDLETLDLLQGLIADYAGTVFLVSHDRDFLDRCCSAVFIAEGDGVWQEYAGGYSDMVAQRGAGVSALDKTGGKQSGSAKGAAKPASAAEAKPERRRMANKDRYALKLLPAEIDKLSEEIAKLEADMADPALFADSARFAQVSKRLGEALQERADKEDRWLELEALREEIEGGG
ncbi:ABC-F family ATP-binding cassette domain-containing protein [Maricaulis maris]|uniref:ATP-binding cassette subfamily F protein uup n=1 Tax=Maricaulis maris TaxID=74318 RepID=A0A495D509_9PROT|nr:ATP-binding cassette domain-containing protein [Maricaulis maris]RKQ96110.1 ATP-binding cassette subfamily F protein uup [Maricaulis maris]